jgi:threonine 3-dehydrogenase
MLWFLAAGPTGLFAIGIAKALGANKIMAVAGTDMHLKLAKKMGASLLIDRHNINDVVKAVMDETNGKGADVCLEMSGAEEAINQALKAVKPVGSVSILGLPTKSIPLDISKDIVMKDLRLRGVYGRKIWDTWKTTSYLLNEKKLDISPIITHRLKMKDFEQGIEAMKSGMCGKVVMTP